MYGELLFRGDAGSKDTRKLGRFAKRKKINGKLDESPFAILPNVNGQKVSGILNNPCTGIK